MAPFEIGLLGVGTLLLLMFLRIPIALSLTAVSFIGIFWIRGEQAAFGALASIPYDFTAHWTLSAIPMFLLMGGIASHSGLTAGLFDAARAWLGRLPGGLAVATNFAGAGFAAASGSSLATTAAMGRIAVPEMLRLGYNPSLATGVAAAVGTLGAIIPPSILIVLYAVFAQAPVGKLLIGGILPGFLTALCYAVMIVVRSSLNPSLAPPVHETYSLRERLSLVVTIWPLPILVIGVIGSIYSGLASATEAAALGALIATLVAAVQGRFSWSVLSNSLRDAVTGTAMIFLIAIGASLFTRFLAFTGIPFQLTEYVVGLSLDVSTILIMTGLVYLVLGMFLDPLGVMLLTLPILLPILDALDVSLIWVGILLVKYMEIGMLTPPVGLNVFVLKGVVGNSISLGTIYKGVAWFLLAELIVVSLLILFPQITLFLPSVMSD
ncbi:TRAP transporter large permease [Hoeflea poritis]|uniref:TRAP transporter large permease protein n=1 Tax=Hoeflea poritis TaxID=2993659 RepID=A0ABT4VV70_9HYPH|nr:TRAP transporter large permease subunit [Hoeflea poritis]MDA4848529.1 TRAP transporter large permease subunit [Hoeflea poritis]